VFWRACTDCFAYWGFTCGGEGKECETSIIMSLVWIARACVEGLNHFRNAFSWEEAYLSPSSFITFL
jgi:hypothetical protein